MDASRSPPVSIANGRRPIAPLLNAGNSTPTPPPALSPVGGPSLTAKEWVVPPRPKPGRKPATDTPPTKRKAQNRAAQRAFRERKASKVGELEEQMEDLERRHEAEVERLTAEMTALSVNLEGRLKSSVSAYEQDVHELHDRLESWRSQCQALEAQLLAERRSKQSVEEELAILKGEAVRLPRRSGQGSHSGERRTKDTGEVVPAEGFGNPEQVPLGCSKCSVLRCQCFEEAMDLNLDANGVPLDPNKRPLSPSLALSQPQKKARAETKGEERQTTPLSDGRSAGYLRKPNGLDVPAADAQESATNEPPIEPCGFCQDESNCLCAEVAADRKHSLLESKPVPSVGERKASNVSTAFVNASSTSEAASEGPFSNFGFDKQKENGPGSCTQCRSNPNSTLFCKSLAATRRKNNTFSSSSSSKPPTSLPQINTIISRIPTDIVKNTYHHHNSSTQQTPLSLSLSSRHTTTTTTTDDNDMELDFTTTTTETLARQQHHNHHHSNQQHQHNPIPTPTTLTLSCAEAFTTLSRHPAFDRASRELGEWLPQLSTTTGAEVVMALPGLSALTSGSGSASASASSSSRSDTAAAATPVTENGGNQLYRADDSSAQAQTQALARERERQGSASTTPGGGGSSSSGGGGAAHTAFEIEAASVMGVLQFFDRRFGRDA